MLSKCERAIMERCPFVLVFTKHFSIFVGGDQDMMAMMGFGGFGGSKKN